MRPVLIYNPALPDPLDHLRSPPYKPGHDAHGPDHYSNYIPGALTLRRRAKVFEPSHRPLATIPI